MFGVRLHSVWFAAALVSAPLAAQSYKLNGPLARTALGRVDSFELSADGTRALYLADASASETRLQLFTVPVDGSAAPLQLTQAELADVTAPRLTADGLRAVFLLGFPGLTRLYCVPLDGSQSPNPLNGAMVPGGTVPSFRLAPLGERVVFLAAKEATGVFELYSREADGAAEPVKLSGPMVAGGDVQAEYAISPDGSWVVYRADQDANDVFDLYAVPIDGSAAPVRLNLTRTLGDVQGDFVIAADSLGVVYRADQDADEVFELYVVRIDGTFAPVKRNPALVAGGDVLSFRLSGVNDRLLYRADQDTDERIELYSVRAVTGGAPQKLNGALGSSDVSDMRLSADATRVVYRVDRTGFPAQLFGVPANGAAAAVQLSAVPAGRNLVSFEVPAADERVLYVQIAGFGTSAELFSAPLDGSQPPLRLSAPQSGSALGARLQGVLADGTVLYLADPQTLAHDELFRVPLDGSASPVRLSGPLVSGGLVRSARGTSDGARIVYLANQDSDQGLELFGVPTSGGQPRRLSGPKPLGATVGDVVAFELSADGSRAAYAAQQGSSTFYDLYGVATDGSGHPRPLNRPLSGIDGIGEFALSPDGARVVYEILRDNSFTVELHSAPSDAAGADVRLDPPADFGGGFFQVVDRFVITPDSSQVVYLADQDTNDVFELFVVPTDGSQPSARLHPPLGPLTSLQEFGLSPDGAWVVYSQSSLAGLELYSLPLDGHQPPTRLNAPFVAGGSLGGDENFGFFFAWRIAPDSSRVVYLADQDTDDVGELYSVPIDGSQAPVKLNGALVAGGEVAPDPDSPTDSPPYVISADGTRVVYRADQDEDERVELYSVPLTGGAAVKLNGALVAGGDVGPFGIDPGSTRVVYEADEETDGVHELYSAPLLGGARVKLNAPLVPGGEVRNLSGQGPAFRLSPLGMVAYHADQLASLRFELFAVPLDGSALPVRLNATLPSGGQVLDDFELTADGASVVYAADQRVNEVVELYHVPLDASLAPRVFSGPLVAGGDVLLERPFRLTADGERVLYLADQDTDGVPEFYAGLLDFQRGPRRAGTPTRTVVR